MIKNKITILIQLFISFCKIGLFTFGGGYAMIPLIQNEVVEKRKWIKEMEMLDIIALSESTPGPISVNMATYIGFRQARILGAIIATFALALPSFLIILGISYIYMNIINLTVINNMFKGIKVAVIILLFNAFVKLSKNVDKSIISIILFIIGLIIMLILSLFNVTVPFLTIWLILLGLIVGLLYSTIKEKNHK